MDSLRMTDALNLAGQNIHQGKFLQIITVNTLMFLDTESDPELQEIFDSAGLVVPDSIGVFLLAFLKRFQLLERIPGIDLMIELCSLSEKNGWPVYLLGSRPGAAEQAADKLKALFPKIKIAGTQHGYFSGNEEPSILNDISARQTRVLFVGLGVPAQEKWIFNNANRLSGICAMGVGGSLDVLSGTLRRAPVWIRSAGMEWIYRWAQEPWRWKRIIRLPLLILKALK